MIIISSRFFTDTFQFLMGDFVSVFFQNILYLFQVNPFGQAFGFIAMIIGVSGFLVHDDRTTVKIFIVSFVFWILHFWYLVNYGALIATAISLVRLILSLKYRKNVSLFLGIVAIIMAYGIYSFDGRIISTLPLFATALSSYAFFFLEKIRLRMILGIVSLMWLIYHLNTGSVSGIMNEIIVQCTLIYSVIMFAANREKKEKILERLKRQLGQAPMRINYGRYIFMRDKNRFDIINQTSDNK